MGCMDNGLDGTREEVSCHVLVFEVFSMLMVLVHALHPCSLTSRPHLQEDVIAYLKAH